MGSTSRGLLLAGAASFFGSGITMANDFDSLTPGAQVAAFTAECVYENESAARIGARFRHDASGFVLDVMRIQSVPQAFVWVNSPPPTDQGEPHTLEHLLLGKGTKGRYVASLEDMALGQSSAYTEQRRTCYHFNTAAGVEVFFQLFEEKLGAMLHPTYSDEEIRREVCHFGVSEQEDGTPWLEEKGTVYNEMVSTYERPWAGLFDGIGKTLYGMGHPLALSSGGEPSAIRDLGPEEIRAFHWSTHHLNNMGAVVSIGDEVSLAECLAQLSGIFARVEPNAARGDDPASLRNRLPAPRPAASGTVVRTTFPNPNPNEPGLLFLAWRPERDLHAGERYLGELLVEALAGGSTSNLYRLFIDSETRKLDIGATGVFSWMDGDLGQPIFLGFSNVRPEVAEEATLTEVRRLVQEELQAIARLEPGSPELNALHERMRGILQQRQRNQRIFLNSPPRFGHRGSGSDWIDRMQRLHEDGGFVRNLALAGNASYADSVLSGPGNPWEERIFAWGLLDEPYMAVSTPDPALLERTEKERDERIHAFVTELRGRYGVGSDQAAIQRYAEEYAVATAEIDSVAATIAMPRFIDEPPLTLDDGLRYEVKEAAGRPLVVSTFETMTSATAGLALRLDAVPESLLMYVPALPTLLREVGMIVDGQPVSYDEVEQRLRREVQSLDVYLSANYLSERVELVLRGSGGTPAESQAALHWMETALFTPDLRMENLPRLRDAVDQAVADTRNRMRGSEESWVDEPATAYLRQSNPLFLSASCFLTESHALHRLRWGLFEGSEPVQREFAHALEAIVNAAGPMERERFEGILESTIAELTTSPDAEPAVASAGSSESTEETGADDSAAEDGAEAEEAAAQTVPMPDALRVQLGSLSPEARSLVIEAARDLQKMMGELPDQNLSADVSYLCEQMAADLARPASQTLQTIETTLKHVRKRDRSRAFVIGGSANMERLLPGIEQLVTKLDSHPSETVAYARTPVVVQRYQERTGETRNPVFVGLINEGTRSGVHLHTASCASYEDNDPEKLLRFLAARIYGGGGAHSMFMKTWSAGLAYSNGLRSNEEDGRITYYAERCPDLAQTMQFVVKELEKAPHDPALGEYAVAQAFGAGRAASGYEQRGEAMAENLADGLTPDKVRAFRQGILDLRQKPDLYDQLEKRMREVYGTVLPGLDTDGATSAKAWDANYFVIGPTKQIDSWDAYLGKVESGAKTARLYPRDFWIAAPRVRTRS